MQEHGYPLHIDATSEHGKGGLFVCMDGFRNWVLCAGKIESESEENLKPFVEKTIELFGDPIGVVRDLGIPARTPWPFSCNVASRTLFATITFWVLSALSSSTALTRF
jgi:hypothetical protein